MTKKSKGSEKATKSSKRSKLASKPVKVTKMATTSAPPSTSVTRSSSAHASIAEGTRLYALAGRPSKTDFIKMYRANGPKMTWAQRATAGVDAKHFQEALKAKSRTGTL